MFDEKIKVVENEGDPVTLSLEDCEKYHGLKKCGGLALGFRLLKFALDRLVGKDGVANRNLITFKTAFDGPGITDSAELIGRCVTRERFMVLPSEEIEAPECIWGKLYFEIGYGKKLVKITVKDDVVPSSFLITGRKFRSNTATPEEIKKWYAQKKKLYKAVLNAKLSDIITVEFS